MKTFLYEIRWMGNITTSDSETEQSLRQSLAAKHRLFTDAIRVWQMQEDWTPKKTESPFFTEDHAAYGKQEKKQ